MVWGTINGGDLRLFRPTRCLTHWQLSCRLHCRLHCILRLQWLWQCDTCSNMLTGRKSKLKALHISKEWRQKLVKTRKKGWWVEWRGGGIEHICYGCSTKLMQNGILVLQFMAHSLELHILLIINPHLIFSLTEVLHRLPKLNHSYFSCILPPANKVDINLWLLLVNELSSCRYSQKRIEKGETIFQFKKSATTLQLRKNVQKKHWKVQLED